MSFPYIQPFLSLSNGINTMQGGLISGDRGIIAGGWVNNTIHYLSIATLGNSVDFGDLLFNTTQPMGNTYSDSRSLFAGGANGWPGTIQNVIQYITIASTGNASDFGDLLAVNAFISSCASPVTALLLGGSVDDGSNAINVIQGVTIATTGNSTDFGDLTIAVFGSSACSNAHGGIA